MRCDGATPARIVGAGRKRSVFIDEGGGRIFKRYPFREIPARWVLRSTY